MLISRLCHKGGIMEKRKSPIEVFMHTSVRMEEILDKPEAEKALMDAQLLDQGVFPAESVPGS
jgi:hypothetical protein